MRLYKAYCVSSVLLPVASIVQPYTHSYQKLVISLDQACDSVYVSWYLCYSKWLHIVWSFILTCCLELQVVYRQPNSLSLWAPSARH